MLQEWWCSFFIFGCLCCLCVHLDLFCVHSIDVAENVCLLGSSVGVSISLVCGFRLCVPLAAADRPHSQPTRWEVCCPSGNWSGGWHFQTGDLLCAPIGKRKNNTLNVFASIFMESIASPPCLTFSVALPPWLTTPSGSTSSRCLGWPPCCPVRTYCPGVVPDSRTRKSPSLVRSLSASLRVKLPWNQISFCSCCTIGGADVPETPRASSSGSSIIQMKMSGKWS